MDKPFQPTGPCTLVDATARLLQGNAVGTNGGQNWRVVNLANAVQYFTYGPTSGVTSVGAPSGGTPSANTIGMAANGVEVFTLTGFTNNALYAIASSSTGFQFTQGDGL